MAKTRTTKTAKRGSGYSRQEVDSFLDTAEVHLPIGQEECEAVAAVHAVRFPDKQRDYISLRRKFHKLSKTGPGTGDPNCPTEVRQAKRILREIKKKAEIATFDDSGTESQGDDDDEEYQSAHGTSDSNDDDDNNNNNNDTVGDLLEPTAPPLRIPIPSAVTTTEATSTGSVTAASVTAPTSVNASPSTTKKNSSS